jgi:hypothetical protein
MAQTLAQQLENVQAAIAAIEDGSQNYQVEGITYTRAKLSDLYAREEKLLNKIAREEAKTGRTVAEF